MDYLIWGAVLRFLQALLQATPTILAGLLIAGVLRRLVGGPNTRKLFGDNTWRALPQAWLVGMLLPVCSLGVIPVLREMKRAGVSGGALLAFGLTAPLFNPISVLYGLTLADPVVILTFSFCSLVIVTVLGGLWDVCFAAPAVAEPESQPAAYGVKRMLSVAVCGARELAGSTSAYILAGLLGVACLSLILPQGYLQTAAEPDDPWAPLFMSLVAIPAYATPMTAMVQLASMFQHGNSVGAAFALLALGAGANLGLAAWMGAHHGLGRTSLWFAALLLVVVGLSYGVDKPLHPQGVEPAGHTHAFDIYCAPFTEGAVNPSLQVWRKLSEDAAPHELVAAAAVASLLLVGLLLALFDPNRVIEAWLEKQPPANQPRRDIVLPAPVLGGVVLASLIAASVIGCYVYYPPPREVFEELKMVNTEVVSAASSRDWDAALYWIPIYDDWTRKLQVAAFLRGQPLSRYQQAKADVLREKLELLEHEAEDQEVDEAQQLGREVNRAYGRLRYAILNDR